MKKLVAIAICFFLLGFLTSYFISKNKINYFSVEKRQGGYAFINPLLECDNKENPSYKKIHNFKNDIEEIIRHEKTNHNISRISVYYRDLNNGPWFGVQEKDFFTPASLLKVPVMMAYLREAEANPEILQSKIKTSKDDFGIDQNINLKFTIQPDKEYSVEDLIRRMISFSDNNSFNVLVNNIGEEKINKIHSDLGIGVATQETPENYISVKTYSSFFRVLYNASYLNRQMSEYALSLLSNTTFTDGIVAGIPQNSIVAHKFGIRQYQDSNEKQLHDCGIVYISVNPYLLCVMTKGDDLEKLAETISKISKSVYENIKTE